MIHQQTKTPWNKFLFVPVLAGTCIVTMLVPGYPQRYRAGRPRIEVRPLEHSKPWDNRPRTNPTNPLKSPFIDRTNGSTVERTPTSPDWKTYDSPLDPEGPGTDLTSVIGKPEQSKKRGIPPIVSIQNSPFSSNSVWGSPYLEKIKQDPEYAKINFFIDLNKSSKVGHYTISDTDRNILYKGNDPIQSMSFIGASSETSVVNLHINTQSLSKLDAFISTMRMHTEVDLAPIIIHINGESYKDNYYSKKSQINTDFTLPPTKITKGKFEGFYQTRLEISDGVSRVVLWIISGTKQILSDLIAYIHFYSAFNPNKSPSDIINDGVLALKEKHPRDKITLSIMLEQEISNNQLTLLYKAERQYLKLSLL